MKRDGEMSTREAADFLGIHIDTIRRWARETASGNPVQITNVRIDAVCKHPRYYLREDEVRSLAGRALRDFL